MSPALTSLFMGARMALRRLGGRSTLLVTFGAVSFCTLAAWAERHAELSTAANNALRGPAFGLAIPIASLALVTLALGRKRLEDAVEPVATLGGGRRSAALGALLATSAVTALLGALTGATTAWIAYGRLDGSVLMDALTAAWIGALAGGVYAFYYGAASSVGKRGGGRLWALVADWLLGPLAGVAAVIFPRAHALNLLGATPVLDLPQVASTAILLGMAGLFAALASLRTQP